MSEEVKEGATMEKASCFMPKSLKERAVHLPMLDQWIVIKR